MITRNTSIDGLDEDFLFARSSAMRCAELGIMCTDL
jgi:hypothetical protein